MAVFGLCHFVYIILIKLNGLQWSEWSVHTVIGSKLL